MTPSTSLHYRPPPPPSSSSVLEEEEEEEEEGPRLSSESNIPTPTLASSSSKQKAALMLRMANAVEDANARRRRHHHYLHDHHGHHHHQQQQHQQQHHPSIDSEAVEHLIQDLSRLNNNDDDEKLTSHTISRSSPRHLAATAAVDPEQVYVLYTAMISYRENADLRYQLLELRHLDLTQSFVELEGRYRRLESEQEALRQEATTKTNDDEDGHDHDNDKNHENYTSTTSHHSLRTSTVPLLQQELQSLNSQRNQLLQANLELRKQLKQLQIKIQQHDGEGKDALIEVKTATCQRCHPELYCVTQQRHVDAALEKIVEPFQSAVPSLLQQELEEEEFEEDDADETFVSNEETKVDQDWRMHEQFQDSMEIRHHDDTMSLLGIEWGDGSNHQPQSHRPSEQPLETKSPPSSSYRRVGMPRPQSNTKPSNIDWAPPPSRAALDAISPIIPTKGRVTLMTKPTLTSFLPMEQEQQSLPQKNSKKSSGSTGAHCIPASRHTRQTSPPELESESHRQNHHHHKEIRVLPRGTSTTIQAPSKEQHKVSPQKQQRQQEIRFHRNHRETKEIQLPSTTSNNNNHHHHHHHHQEIQFAPDQPKNVLSKVFATNEGSHYPHASESMEFRNIPQNGSGIRNGGATEEITPNIMASNSSRMEERPTPQVEYTLATTSSESATPTEEKVTKYDDRPATSNATNRQGNHGNGMNSYGVLDEYGRSTSYKLSKNVAVVNPNLRGDVINDNGNRNTLVSHACALDASDATIPINNTSIATKNISPFRRRSTAVHPPSSRQQQQSTLQHPGTNQGATTPARQRQRHSTSSKTTSPANGTRHAYHNMQNHAPQHSILTDARHLEFSAPSCQPAVPNLQMRTRQAGRANEGGHPRLRRTSYDKKVPALPATAMGNVTGRPGQVYGGRHAYQNPQSHAHPLPRVKGDEGKPPPERQSKPQSYFERIKKTLQQEI